MTFDRSIRKRFIAMLLAAIMIFSCVRIDFPGIIFATEPENATATDSSMESGDSEDVASPAEPGSEDISDQGVESKEDIK